MLLLVLAKYLIGSRPNSSGGTNYYYYYDEYTWAAAVIALAWFAWIILKRYLRTRALRRPPRKRNHRPLKRIVRIKRQLSSLYLQPGFSANIHAVGIGLAPGSGNYCIQVFVNDARAELSPGSRGAALPRDYLGVPLVLIEMPMAGFLSDVASNSSSAAGKYSQGIREPQEIIVGGISGANTNLTGQSGTIGYFCTRRSTLRRRREVHLLSNSHVFVDLRKGKVDATDLIVQPSPGEPSSNRPIATLVNFSTLKFGNGPDDPNRVDAAIAKLWGPHPHKPVIPMIGSVIGQVNHRDIELGERVRKFGRTTGYTEGTIFSLYLDIRIRYDRTGQSAFFNDQILIAPVLPEFTKFVSKGDSGSVVIDREQRAIGLIFGGMSELPPKRPPDMAKQKPGEDPTAQRIESYGVANPISDVLDRMKIDLLIM
jgi:hypothetical protein